MPSALSVDLRERVVAAIEAGASRRQAAQRFGVGRPAQSVGTSASDRTGRSPPKPMGGDRNSQRLEAQAALILRLNEEHPLSFLRELRDRLSECGVRASTSSLSRFFARHGSPVKRGCPRAEQERSDVRAAREDWFDRQPDLDPDRLVFPTRDGRHDEDGPPLWPCSLRSALPDRRAPRTLQDHHHHRRPARHGTDR